MSLSAPRFRNIFGGTECEGDGVGEVVAYLPERDRKTVNDLVADLALDQ